MLYVARNCDGAWARGDAIRHRREEEGEFVGDVIRSRSKKRAQACRRQAKMEADLAAQGKATSRANARAEAAERELASAVQAQKLAQAKLFQFRN